MRMNAFLTAVMCMLLPATVCGAQTTPAPQGPSAFLPEAAFQFAEVVEGTQILHDFIMQNKGARPLTIEKVETS